jgi:hypothetical protein
VFALSSISIRGEMLKLVRALDPSCSTPARPSVGFNLCLGAAISALVGNGVLLLMMWPMSSLHADDVKRWDVEAAERERKKAAEEAAPAASPAGSGSGSGTGTGTGTGTGAGTGTSRSSALTGAGASASASTSSRSASGAVGPLARPVLEWSRDDVYTWAITSSRADAGAMPGLGLAADVAAKIWNANITGAFLMSSTPEELGQRCLAVGLQLSVVSSMADGVAALKRRAA